MSVRRVDRRSVVVHSRDASNDERTTSQADRIAAKLDSTTGFLIVDGRVSRGDCVQQYSDGVTTWGELRRVTDVYDAPALASMAPRPIVDSDHPWVDAKTWRELAKGSTGPARVDSKSGWCTQQLAICDSEMIAKVVDGEAIEISIGYECTLIPEEGEYEGAAYSYRQTDVRVNHVALGPRDWARAGNDACLIFDSAGSTERVGVQVITGDTVTNKNKKTKSKQQPRRATDRKPAPKSKLVVKDGMLMIGDVEYEVDDAVIAYVDLLLAGPSEEEIDEVNESGDEGVEESVEYVDEDVEEERTDSKLKDRHEALADSFKRYKDGELSRVGARASLISDAREILGRHAKIDSLPAREIHKQVITKLLGSGAPKLDGRSAEYVEATYDNVILQQRDSHSIVRAIGHGQIQGRSQGHQDNKTVSLDSLQSDFMDRLSGKKAS